MMDTMITINGQPLRISVQTKEDLFSRLVSEILQTSEIVTSQYKAYVENFCTVVALTLFYNNKPMTINISEFGFISTDPPEFNSFSYTLWNIFIADTKKNKVFNSPAIRSVDSHQYMSA